MNHTNTQKGDCLDRAIEECIGVMGNKAFQGSYAAPREAFMDILRRTIASETTKATDAVIERVITESLGIRSAADADEFRTTIKNLSSNKH